MWYTTSTPGMARRIEAGLVRSPSTAVTPAAASGDRSKRARLFGLTSARTSSPRAARVAARWPPVKPVAPVTSTFTSARSLPLRRLRARQAGHAPDQVCRHIARVGLRGAAHVRLAAVLVVGDHTGGSRQPRALVRMLDQIEHRFRKRLRLRRDEPGNRGREHLRMRQQIGGHDRFARSQVRIDLERRIRAANAGRDQQVRRLHEPGNFSRGLLAGENHRRGYTGGVRLRLRRLDLRRLAADHEHAGIRPAARDDRDGVDQHLDALVRLERPGVKRQRRTRVRHPTRRAIPAASASAGHPHRRP